MFLLPFHSYNEVFIHVTKFSLRSKTQFNKTVANEVTSLCRQSISVFIHFCTANFVQLSSERVCHMDRITTL